MKKLGNNIHQIGGGGQKTQNTNSTTGGWRTPWWVFRLIKFLHEISPLFARIFGLTLEMLVKVFSFVWTFICEFFSPVTRIPSFILSNKKLIMGCLIAWGGLYLFNRTNLNVDIPLYVVIGPPVVSIIILVLVLWLSRRGKDASPEDDGMKKKTGSRWERFKKWITLQWTKGRVLPILTCFALIHLALFKLAPGFWQNNICNWWSFGLQAALGIAISVKPEDPKKPGKYKLSTVATLLLCITLLIHIGGVSVEGAITKVTTWWETELSKENTLRTAPVTSTGEVKYPRDEHWPDKDVAEQILEGQWDLLAACYRESGLKQFGSDGKPLVNENKNGLGMVTSTDTGICQINSVHDPELKRLGLDKNKLEDNLKFAKILYEKEGLKPWNIKPGQKLTFQVSVSLKGSNTFKRPQNVYTLFNNKESVRIALNNERWTTTLEADPGFTDFTPAGTILDYKFTLLPEKTDNAWVTVTYTYQ